MDAASLDIPPTDKVESKIEDGIGWLVFNNPERRNAISIEMAYAAGKILEGFASDPVVRVVILRGGGEKAFISGGDISGQEKQKSTPELRARYSSIHEGARESLHTMGKPTIAMIHGYCLGGGLGYALNCDLRICSDDARFGIPAAKLSIGYPAKGIRQLLDLIGPSRTKEMLYTARHYSANEALGMGLVNQVLAKVELESYVRNYAAVIAGNAPLAILNAKTAVNELLKDPDQRDMELVARCANAATQSQDNVEGRKAFLEKRKPVFTGK